jgi:nucleoside-diphosphate-sugar epimerase
MGNNNPRTRILLTGGSGLVGRGIAEALRQRAEITHFDLADPGDGLPWVRGSLCDPAAVEAACQDQDVVLHVAALHGQAWAAAGDYAGFEVNVMGTHNILEGARKGGAWRVIFTSSIWATGHAPAPSPYLPIDEALRREPVELYGLTKKLGEQMCRYASERHGLSTLCLRPAGILRADAPPSARVGLLFGAVDVRDVVAAHVLALDAPDDILHDTFIVAADSPLCRYDPAHVHGDLPRVLEELFPGISPLIGSGMLRVPALPEWYTIAKAKRVLGYAPRHPFALPAEAQP